MKRKYYLIAKKIKEALSDSVQLTDFRVFGSTARGDEDQYSDMDVYLEVLKINKTIKNKIFDIIWDIGFKNYMVISPIIYTKNEITNTPLRSSPLIKNISKEGIKV